MLLTIIPIATPILFALIGAKKGIVRSVFSLVGSLLVFYISRFAAKAAMPLVVGKIPLPGIGTSLTTALNKLELGTKSYEGVVAILNEKGFPEGLSEYIAGKIDYTTEGVSSLAIQVSTVFDSVVAYVLCFVLATLLSILLIAFITGILDGILKLPVLRTANTITGAIAGFIVGLLICWIVVLTLSWLFPVIDGCFSTELASTAMNSSLYQFFVHTNPFQIFI